MTASECVVEAQLTAERAKVAARIKDMVEQEKERVGSVEPENAQLRDI